MTNGKDQRGQELASELRNSGRPIRLTDGQLRLLQRAAERVPVLRRDAFLQSIARRLGPEPSVPALEAAINLALGVAPEFSMEP
jgi:hypothetical protein